VQKLREAVPNASPNYPKTDLSNLLRLPHHHILRTKAPASQAARNFSIGVTVNISGHMRSEPISLSKFRVGLSSSRKTKKMQQPFKN
jgi:hypothetical protein